MSDSGTRTLLQLCDQWLETDEGRREQWLADACGGDTALEAQVLAVVQSITMASEVIGDNVDAPEANWSGQQLGSYTLKHRLGEGGMGSVYLADREHADFQQTVAVKIIRQRFVSPALIAQFNAEREILASLTHPYIAQLIDGGTAEGTPYLVMEYVDGVSVDTYLREHAESHEARVEMVRKIAMAVHAAHQNLIVHKDLKPSNVLVTTDGIPKLLDFGIAGSVEAVDPSGDSAQALTPNYASPEQLLNRRVTTLSDVYSLGAMACELITGTRPYSLDLDAAIQQATQEAPIALPRSLPTDLSAIIGKAMAKSPQDRYTSVAAFSADLQRYLDGTPVDAQTNTWRYRFGRFIARNRLAAGFSAALLLSLVLGLVASTWSFLRAEAARADATARFDQVRTLARTMMFDVYDDLALIPGTASLRETLAGTAQSYLQTLATDASTPWAVRLDAAQGYARLYSVLNREVVDDADNRTRALAAFDSAEALFKQLQIDAPDRIEAWHGHGDLLSARGSDVLTIDNDTEAGQALLNQADALLEQAQTKAPDNTRITVSRYNNTLRKGKGLQWADDYQGVIDLLTTLLADIASRNQTAEFARIAGDAHQLRGESHYWIDEYDDAIANYGQAIDVYKVALELGGPNQAISDELSTTYWSRGNSYVDTSKPEQAVVDYGEAMTLVETVVARDPGDTSSARQLAILRASKAMALARTGERDEPIVLMSATNDWFEAQAKADPNTSGPQRSLAISYHMMADVSELAQGSNAACPWFKKALEKWLEVDARFGIADFDQRQPDLLRDEIAKCES